MQDTNTHETVHITDGESLGRGLTLMNLANVQNGEAIQALAFAIGIAARAHPELHSTLLACTDAEATGGGRKILDVLKAALEYQTPPPFGGTRLRIVGGTAGPEAKAA